MELGWIDFSKEDRDKALNVIHLLQEPGAVDELGIGIIRDAFANLFFPGTSTIQTRAKYFLIVPYTLKEAGDGQFGNDINVIRRKIDDDERNCAVSMMNNGSRDGVIGSTILPNRWVTRKPLDIYWNGIRTLKIYKSVLSVDEYLHQTIRLRKLKAEESGIEHGEENESDDINAGDVSLVSFWNLPTYRKDWRENLKIDLTKEEAQFLKTQIETVLNGSLFSYTLQNDIGHAKDQYKDFYSFSQDMSPYVDSDLRDLMKLANGFNNLVYLARVRYNVMLSNGHNEEAAKAWKECASDIQNLASVDLNSIYKALTITNIPLRHFLDALQEMLLNGKNNEADDLIRKREIQIKSRSRAKLEHCENYPDDEWVGGKYLDYRMSSALRIIRDIYEGESRSDV